MIGTNSSFRSRAAFAMLAFTCIGLALAWGCSDAPFSNSSGERTVTHNAIPAPYGHELDAGTTVGPVEEIDHTAMRLRVAGLWFFVDLETEIQIDDCKPCAFANIQPGDPAKVKHDRVPALDNAYYAREVEIEHEDDNGQPEHPEDDEAETEGVVGIIDGDRLLVAGAWFWMDGATEIEIDRECTIDVIVAGDYVKIEHSTVIIDGLGYYAYKIEIKRGCDEEKEDVREQ